MRIEYGEQALKFSEECALVFRNVISGIGDFAYNVKRGYDTAVEIKTKCFETRDKIYSMAEKAKEGLISVNNILSADDEDKAYWEKKKEKINVFIKKSNEFLPILDGACAYLERAMEEADEYERAFMDSVEKMGNFVAYGMKKLSSATEAMIEINSLKALGE